MSELKPCPFCGGKAEFEEESVNGSDFDYVVCCNCGSRSEGFICGTVGAVEAAAEWNNRSPQSEWVSETDEIIHDLFSRNWSGDLSDSPIEDMRAQLYKNLKDQLNGFWSGHTAYKIMTKGGFLIDSKRIPAEGGKCKPKQLTVLGEMFMKSMEGQIPTPPKGK